MDWATKDVDMKDIGIPDTTADGTNSAKMEDVKVRIRRERANKVLLSDASEAEKLKAIPDAIHAVEVDLPLEGVRDFV